MEHRYRENHGFEDNEPMHVQCVLRVGQEDYIRTFTTTALSPMGVAQHQLCDELGLELHHVQPVSWTVIR